MNEWKNCVRSSIKGYKRLTIDELDLEAVETLVGTIIRMNIEAYADDIADQMLLGKDIREAIAAVNKTNPEHHRFFRSEYFFNLTGGLVDGSATELRAFEIAKEKYQELLKKKKKKKYTVLRVERKQEEKDK